MRKSISRQQSLSFIDYIYLNKSKSYAGHMQAKLKQRKIILENFGSSYSFFPQAKRDNPSKSATNQRLKLKCSVAFVHIISRNILIRVLLKRNGFPKFKCSCIFQMFGFAVTAEKKFNN